MDRIVLSAPAKINLFLEITGTDHRGYHLLDTVMQSVSLCDLVLLSRRREGFFIASNEEGVPTDESNLAFKAAAALCAELDIALPSLSIYLEKRIPSEAGLGGGSSDAAAVLIGLNRLLGTNLSTEKLCDIGEKVGADVPFCVLGGTALARGIGEKLMPLKPLPGCHIVIAKPAEGISTREAFYDYDRLGNKATPQDGTALLKAITASDLTGLGSAVYNTLEQIIPGNTTETIKAVMGENGAVGAALSGSGSAVFGLFDSKAAAERCAEALRETKRFVFMAVPVSGVKILYED
ncbi:MAG: 4-(cytidine 5'-diphospho)-2-C-methyl-D-erythritol kinase [Oscillospiraceae bacterium]